MNPLFLAVLAGCADQNASDPGGLGDDITLPEDTTRPTDSVDTGDEDTTPDPTDDDGDGFADDDCDDSDPTSHPGAPELCDGVDNDCDGAGDADTDTDGIVDCADDCPIQVDITAAAGGDGTVAHPFQAIQDGIDAAPDKPCWEVEVHPGTYEETIDFMGYPVDVRAVDGPDVTVIDGGGAGPVVTFQTGEPPEARLLGFTVTGGEAERGAGIYVSTGAPTIEGNVVSDNVASGLAIGGGIYLYDTDAWVIDNTIEHNDAGMGGIDDGNDGGGIAVLYGAPTIEDNHILGNTAGDGGGIWVAHGEALMIQNFVDGNRADDLGREDDLGYVLAGQGGGVAFQADTEGVTFASNVVTNNQASTHGGGIAIIGFYVASDVAEPTVVNNTLAFNAVDPGGYGDGIVTWGIGRPVVSNNILWGHNGTGIYAQSKDATLTWNDVVGPGQPFGGDVQDLTGTDGNLGVDPSFKTVSDDGDGTNDDYTLKATSDCVDAGDPDILDVDGTRSDMGAYGGPYGTASASPLP